MPRLLSNKSPKKNLPVKVEKKSNLKVEEKPKQKNIGPTKNKTEDEMSAWEYYSFLMRFGKRKMDRYEWLTWKLKKDEEDWNKKYTKDGRRKISVAEFNWRIKNDLDFDDSMIEVDCKLK